MDNNNFDSKKVIQMVAIIGILCLFVGIATRIRQNGQKTLADYESPSKTNISESGTTATTPNDSESDTDTDFNSNNENGIDSADNESDSSDSTNSNGASSNSNILSEMTQEEYDAFYYTDNSDGTSLLHLLYYNTSQELTTGLLECNSNEAYDLLLIFYKLYKNHYEFTSILPVGEFESEEAARAANNTYCLNGTISINPLYNPYIAYDGCVPILTPQNAYDYIDRSAAFPYKITDQDYAYVLFTEAGYYWGGYCNGYADYGAFRK